MDSKPAMALIDAPVTPQQQAQPNPKSQGCNTHFEFVNARSWRQLKVPRCKPIKHAEQLLPGILNEITLDHITPKLPWRDVVSLSSIIHVLDLAGQGLWSDCARMRKGRAKFGCGILDGKIYVFGGKIDNERVVYDSEVYDSKNGVWSPNAPMKSDRVVHRVGTVGEELVVHCGYDWTVMPMVGGTFGYFSYGGQNPLLQTHALRFYNPVKDEWRDLRYECMRGRASFIAQGKLFSLTPEAIYIHEVAAEAWTELWQ